MNRSTRIRTIAVSIVCAAAVGITGVGTAQAAAATSGNDADAAVDSGVTDEQINELARYLEAITEGEIYGPDGKFDYDKTRAQFGVEFADAVAAEIAANKGQLPDGTEASYVSCLLKGVGLGGILGATGNIANALKKKHFKEAAKLISKEAVKRGIKIGVKGGVAGLAAALAGYAVWCAMPWSGEPAKELAAA